MVYHQVLAVRLLLRRKERENQKELGHTWINAIKLLPVILWRKIEASLEGRLDFKE